MSDEDVNAADIRAATHIEDWFSQHDGFTFNRRMTTMHEFIRLLEHNEWEVGSQTARDVQRDFQRALVSQFHEFYDGTSRDVWEPLCTTMRINPMPTTLEECKRVFEETHVNIVDLIDARRIGSRVEVFESVKALSEYTKKTLKYFPLQQAKSNDLLSCLLRPIGRPGRRRGGGRRRNRGGRRRRPRRGGASQQS